MNRKQWLENAHGKRGGLSGRKLQLSSLWGSRESLGPAKAAPHPGGPVRAISKGSSDQRPFTPGRYPKLPACEMFFGILVLGALVAWRVLTEYAGWSYLLSRIAFKIGDDDLVSLVCIADRAPYGASQG